MPRAKANPLDSAPKGPKTGRPDPTAEDEGRALIGRTIDGKYLVRSVLGRGGMGTVYEGVNVKMGRVVALKVLHPRQVKKNESVKRFHQEARAAGAFGHPNICEVYDLGTLEDGSPYLVMERLVGSTLSWRAKQGVLPFDAAIDTMIQVLSGLVVAHDKGIVHRDLKPDNIFLVDKPGWPPVAKVLDFGVSKVISSAPSEPRDSDLDLTRTGMVMGTPYYMSPEQASGARDLDGRVDLYACGVILYEVLTGRRPFLGPNYHVLLWNILKTEPPAPRELRPDLPPALEAVIARAMARERAERYASAQEFMAALAHVRAHLTDDVLPRRLPSTPAPQARAASAPPASAAKRPSSARPAAPASRKATSGHSDVSSLKDFSLSDEGDNDATTTLMKDEEVAAIARSGARPSLEKPPLPEPFDAARTEVSRPARPVHRDPHNDETVRMDRADLGPLTARPPKRT